MRASIFICAAALAAGATAHAQDYVKVFGGGTLGVDHDYTLGPVDSEYDTDLGYTIGGAVGRSFSDFLSVEGEVAWRSNEIDGPAIAGDDDINALSFMANGVLHGPSQLGGLPPYAGLGAGAARIAAADDSDLVFAYQAFGGVSKSFGPNVSAGIEYRYLDANEARFRDAFSTEYDSHGVNLTLTRKF